MTRSFPRCSTFLALLAVLLCCGIAMAQSSASQDSQEQDQSTTFKVSVDVVQLFFNVKDKHNGLIGGLKKEDFQLFEDEIGRAHV